MSSENKNDKVWHEQQENILEKWSEIGSSYRFMMIKLIYILKNKILDSHYQLLY